jgi:UDP-hydrolysing UDP-N-acetyl-D-glucosamine 2-epimerase
MMANSLRYFRVKNITEFDMSLQSRNKSQKILIFTMNRSDFSGIAPVLEELRGCSYAKPILVAGGMHLSKRFGEPLELLKERGISASYTLQSLMREFDTPAQIAYEISELSVEVAKIIELEGPDAIFILGDRYELVPIALCGLLFGVPIIHHSGGDLTEGSLDNQFRFAVSQLAHLHLVANATHRDRLIEMGEERWRIHIVGEPTIEDNSWNEKHKFRLSELLGGQPGIVNRFALVCLHPSPFEGISAKEMVDVLVAGLEHYAGTILVTPPNQDIGGSDIHQKLKEISDDQPLRFRYVQTLGKGLFNAALYHADFIIGNSSANLLDASQFQLPSLNLGIRQQGRESGSHVIHLPYDIEQIQNAIQGIEKTSRPPTGTIVKRAKVSSSSKIAKHLVGRLDKKKLLNKRILFGKKRWASD